MANNKNLKPIRSESEAREKGKNGGKKSGEVRRERKAIKEELLLLLSQGDLQEKLSLALINKALSGDVRAFETIRDTIGEKPIEKQEILSNTGFQKIFVTPEEISQANQHIDEVINDRA